MSLWDKDQKRRASGQALFLIAVIVFEKKDSVFLNRELQDSLIFHIENAIRNEKIITSYISTNTSKITMTWNKRTYELQYHNMKQRGLISFLKKHSPIHIK